MYKTIFFVWYFFIFWPKAGIFIVCSFRFRVVIFGIFPYFFEKIHSFLGMKFYAFIDFINFLLHFFNKLFSAGPSLIPFPCFVWLLSFFSRLLASFKIWAIHENERVNKRSKVEQKYTLFSLFFWTRWYLIIFVM